MTQYQKSISKHLSRLFVTRRDVYAVQTPDGYNTVREPLRLQELQRHLSGAQTIATYSLSVESTVKYICWDVDCKNEPKARRMTTTLIETLSECGLPHDLIEFSGRKGWHVFVFCKPQTSAATARNVGIRVLEASGLSGDVNSSTHVEVFPKQDSLPEGRVGNCLKLPLGLHRVAEEMSFFVDRKFIKVEPQKVLELLESIQPREIDPDSFPGLPTIKTAIYSSTKQSSPSGSRERRDPVIDAIKEHITVLNLEPGLEGAAPGQWKDSQECPLDAHAGRPFSIKGDGEAWKCHSCDKQGDIFNFVRERDRCDFPTARQRLSELLPDDSVRRISATALPENPTIVDKLYASFMDRTVEVYCGPDGVAYAELQAGDGQTIVIAVEAGSGGLAARKMRAYYKADYTRVAGNSAYIRSALEQVISDADGNQSDYEFRLRSGQLRDAIFYNLNSNNQAVCINRDGWEIVTNPPVKFKTSQFCKPIIIQDEESADITLLRQLLNVEPRELPLIYAWLTHCLFPDIPYVILNFLGEAGTGKTTAGKMLRSIIDPSGLDTTTRSRKVRDSATLAAHTFVLPIDNVTHLSPVESDFLCGVATGSNHVSRKMRTNYELSSASLHNPVVLTSIAPPTARNDFQSRCLPIALQPIDQVVEEASLWDDFERLRSQIFMGVVEAATAAHTKWNSLDGMSIDLPRMAGFAKVGYLAAPSWDLTGDEWLDLYRGKLTEGLQETLDSSPILEPLEVLIQAQNQWTGTAKNLLNELEVLCEGSDHLNHNTKRDWPKTPHAMAWRLRDIAKGLRVDWGWTVQQPTSRTGGQRLYHIAKNESQQTLEEAEFANA